MKTVMKCMFVLKFEDETVFTKLDNMVISIPKTRFIFNLHSFLLFCSIYPQLYFRLRRYMTNFQRPESRQICSATHRVLNSGETLFLVFDMYFMLVDKK